VVYQIVNNYKRKRKGRKSTILTGPLGIQESEEEKLKTLLGD